MYREITKVKMVDKKRYEIHLDGKLAFVLYKGELRSFDIHENSYMDEADYNKIMGEILPKRALLRCGHLLEKRDYTEHQLRDKLKMALYPKEAIDYAINKVTAYGFVNDDNYAERFVQSKIGKLSINTIKTKLYQKGISKEIIDKAIDNLETSEIAESEDELIRRLLAKRHYYDSSKDGKEKSKQYRYLMAKGFSGDAIRRNLEVPFT